MRNRIDVRVLVVDDHPVFRVGLVAALRSIGFGRVDEAEDGLVALAKVRGHTYDIVVTDLKMPRLNGIEVAEALRRTSDPPVVMLTTFDEPAVVELAKRSGVRAILSKETEPDVLGNVIDEVMGGSDYSGTPAVVPELTPRERDVVRELLLGRPLKEIAISLDLGTATVKDHVANVYAKFEVHDRVGFVLAARRLGFATLHDLSPDGSL